MYVWIIFSKYTYNNIILPIILEETFHVMCVIKFRFFDITYFQWKYCLFNAKLISWLTVQVLQSTA